MFKLRWTRSSTLFLVVCIKKIMKLENLFSITFFFFSQPKYITSIINNVLSLPPFPELHTFIFTDYAIQHQCIPMVVQIFSFAKCFSVFRENLSTVFGSLEEETHMAHPVLKYTHAKRPQPRKIYYFWCFPDAL